jgi:hypothetical protein
MIDKLRCGDFLSSERLRRYPLILIVAYALSLGFLIVTSHDAMDALGRPLGTDFSQVYAAGIFVREGRPAAPFDNAAHAAKQREIFGSETPFYSWGYPPYFLAIAAVLAFLPYLGALLLWQAATLAGYLAVMWRILPVSGVLAIALAYPAAYINVTHGQNGFFTAALMAGALVLLDRRPMLAGILTGLLAYKPQFCVLMPVALMAGGYWRVIAAAALTLAAMTLATLLGFGIESWTAFLASLPFSREVVIEQGATGFEKFQTIFGAVRLLGGSVGTAYILQGASTILCAALIMWLWRSGADRRLAIAALLGGSLLATPYALDYDMVVVGPAITLLAAYGLEHGFRPYEKLILAAIWCTPFVARTIAGATHLPIGVLSVVLLVLLATRRAYIASGLVTSPSQRIVSRSRKGEIAARTRP